ncbi:hypothetical protein AVEN_103259-1 [Araneus ventricosus]|uniref:Uncharacterized protein n=1 Tax=Araneus ventricosus TaxID=182803 RepID=A0A4Y2HNN0_ARAVE|nr:hypothetical protein AVEN_103259-1 [Araneus ventricosus]
MYDGYLGLHVGLTMAFKDDLSQHSGISDRTLPVAGSGLNPWTTFQRRQESIRPKTFRFQGKGPSTATCQIYFSLKFTDISLWYFACGGTFLTHFLRFAVK